MWSTWLEYARNDNDKLVYSSSSSSNSSEVNANRPRTAAAAGPYRPPTRRVPSPFRDRPSPTVHRALKPLRPNLQALARKEAMRGHKLNVVGQTGASRPRHGVRKPRCPSRAKSSPTEETTLFSFRTVRSGRN
ncbi:hypothetical protein PanWU01x14_199510 [Parasponia andersonii]|uniref:Uncharacterized protein n=1 Tax=Parasponia andersonii TaxID=3476 RepID=A0A2P5BYF3_PARAD|nr:hypothetical protein PanWU01x14_199510 [Parasponia andersonii]